MKRFSFVLALLAGLSILGGCGIIEETRDYSKSMDTKMDKTNAGVHRQTLALALEGLFSEEATENLQVPARMMPYAKAFAEEAEAEEIILEFHALYKDMTLAYNADAARRVKTGKVNEQGEEETYAVWEESDLRARSRMISYVAGCLISAFTSDEKVEEILRKQVVEGGRHQDSAYAFAMCRNTATQDYLLGSTLKTRNVNVDTLREAVRYFQTASSIAKKSYVGDMKLTIPMVILQKNEKGEITGAADLEASVDAEKTARMGRTAKRFFESKLSADALAKPETKELLQQLVR